jgi:hypothetical protein
MSVFKKKYQKTFARLRVCVARAVAQQKNQRFFCGFFVLKKAVLSYFLTGPHHAPL